MLYEKGIKKEGNINERRDKNREPKGIGRQSERTRQKVRKRSGANRGQEQIRQREDGRGWCGRVRVLSLTQGTRCLFIGGAAICGNNVDWPIGTHLEWLLQRLSPQVDGSCGLVFSFRISSLVC